MLAILSLTHSKNEQILKCANGTFNAPDLPLLRGFFLCDIQIVSGTNRKINLLQFSLHSLRLRVPFNNFDLMPVSCENCNGSFRCSLSLQGHIYVRILA